MRTQAGYLHLGRVRGVALAIHWSTPLVALLISGLRFEPVLWACFWLIIVAHELGHAVLVRAAGLEVVAIELTGAGGQCRWRGTATDLEQAIIAWGGVIAQLVLVAVALLARAVLGAPQTRIGFELFHAFTELNLWIAAFNLIPIAPFDGARAWSLFGELERTGTPLGRLLAAPLGRWARRRRSARAGGPGTPSPSDRSPSAPRRRKRRRRQAEPASSPQPPADGESPQPSAEAQRELAALLERIANDAGKAKRR